MCVCGRVVVRLSAKNIHPCKISRCAPFWCFCLHKHLHTYVYTSWHVCLNIFTRMSTSDESDCLRVWWKWLPRVFAPAQWLQMLTVHLVTLTNMFTHTSTTLQTHRRDTFHLLYIYIFSPSILLPTQKYSHIYLQLNKLITESLLICPKSAYAQFWCLDPHANIHIYVYSTYMSTAHQAYVYSSSSSSRRFFSPVAARCGGRCVDRWVYIHAWIHNYGYVHGCASLEICVSMSVYICAWTGEYRSMREF